MTDAQRIELEALITEREALVATHAYDNKDVGYPFLQIAARIRALATQATEAGYKRVATHRCKVCGALWQQIPPEPPVFPRGSWTLISEKCGPCCDNEIMDDQIESLNAEPKAETETDRMRSALQIIHTWATFEHEDMPRGHALVPEQVERLCAKALERETCDG